MPTHETDCAPHMTRTMPSPVLLSRRAAGAGLLLAALAAAMAPGCTGAHGGLAGLGAADEPRAERGAALSDAAARLGLTVVDSCGTLATLRNRTNVVVLYANPLGSVWVNGAELPDSHGIVAAEGTLRVPEELLARIGNCLRPVTAAAPAPAERPRQRPAGPQRPRAQLGCVVLDPGHGGRDTGAISVLGHREKDIVLRVARAAADELERKGVHVELTRGDDRFIELEDRPAVAQRCRADLFVSIHADWARNGSASGSTMYVSRSAGAGDLRAAQVLCRQIGQATSDSRGVRRADYRVLVHAKCPAVLVELGYLSHRAEAARLADAAHQERLAEALADAIVDYLSSR